MLKLMGKYEIGTGVGKSNQGILNPVEIKARKKGECLGNGKEETKEEGKPLIEDVGAKARESE